MKSPLIVFFILQGDVLKLTYRGHCQSSSGGALYCFDAEKHEDRDEDQSLPSRLGEVSDQELQGEENEVALQLQQRQPTFYIEFMGSSEDACIHLNKRTVKSIADAIEATYPLQESFRWGLAKICDLKY